MVNWLILNQTNQMHSKKSLNMQVSALKKKIFLTGKMIFAIWI